MICIVCLGGITFFALKSDEENTGFEYHEDGIVTLGEGFTAYGFYSEEGQFVDSGGDIECDNGHVKGQVEFQQNHEGTTEYGLILMLDFIQREFMVEDTAYQMYRFSLTGEDDIRIDVDIDVMEGADRLTYLIIMEPDLRDFSLKDEDGWNNFMVTKNVYSNSYFISDESGQIAKEDEVISTDELPELEFDGNVGFELIKSELDMSVFDSAKGGEEAVLCIGGMGTKAEICTAVAFCNWEQVPVIQGELIQSYSCVPGRNSYEKIIFPDMQEEAVYQAFLFDASDGYAKPVRPTFRIKIEGREVE